MSETINPTPADVARELTQIVARVTGQTVIWDRSREVTIEELHEIPAQIADWCFHARIEHYKTEAEEHADCCEQEKERVHASA